MAIKLLTQSQENTNNISLVELSKKTDLYLTKYYQLIFFRDFNAGFKDKSIKNFRSSYKLTIMVKLNLIA